MKYVRKIAQFVIPYAIYIYLPGLKFRIQRFKNDIFKNSVENFLRFNAVLRNREEGRRCVILGNAPSVNNIDLSKIDDVDFISVSNGYLHRDYELLSPKYHVVPQITYGKMTTEDVIEWFREMDKGIGDAVIVLSDTEKLLVESNGLFQERVVHYVKLEECFDDYESRELVDLSVKIPRVESVPVLALMLAMYLGYKEIFLIGVDHDHVFSGKYEYAFELGVQKGKDVNVLDCQVVTPLFEEFHSLSRLWRQYRKLNQIAKNQQIMIYNGSPYGCLDEYERRLIGLKKENLDEKI